MNKKIHSDPSLDSTVKTSFGGDEFSDVDIEMPTDPKNGIVDESKMSTNKPHPSLEAPVFYHALQSIPCLLNAVRFFYTLRWQLSYPLQHRLPFSRKLKKLKIVLTWAELFMLLPFFACVVSALLYSFLYPSVTISGHASRTPLIFAFVTATRNSVLTLLFGLPFERAIKYHKLSARLAYFGSLLHTYVAFAYPGGDRKYHNFGEFLFFDQVNVSGSFLTLFMSCMIITALPYVRRVFFEVFYYLHILFCCCMVCCALFHTGYLVPLLVGLTWGLDVLLRRVYMAAIRYFPTRATLRVISTSVVEVSFRKTRAFSFNPGQYVFIAIPDLSFFEWHPFSLSSSPEQEMVTLHIRKAGSWTTKLHDLAASNTKTEVNLFLEGPYGSVGVDLMSDKYQSVLLFSGGIGVTPMQSICNQLMYEHSTGQRQLNQLSFVWTERDPTVMQEIDAVRRSSSLHFSSLTLHNISSPDHEDDSALDDQSRSLVTGSSNRSHAEEVEAGEYEPIAAALLSMIPPSRMTDDDLLRMYPYDEFADLDDVGEDEAPEEADLTFEEDPDNSGHGDEEQGAVEVVVDTDLLVDESGQTFQTTSHKDNDPIVDQAYNILHAPKAAAPDRRAQFASSKYPTFVTLGRPDVKGIFQQLREEALARGETRVAVCVCAPGRLVDLCRKACVKYSDRKLVFDFHSEVFE